MAPRMRICYVGAGRLGLSLAAWSAHKGHQVICADVNPATEWLTISHDHGMI